MPNQENEHVIVGGTRGHAAAVREESSHGINDIRFILERFPNTVEIVNSGEFEVTTHGHEQRSTLYPQSPEQFDEVEIPEAAFEALRKFKRAKTFNLSIEQRLEHMKIMAADLAEAHDIRTPSVSMEACSEANRNAAGISGASSYAPGAHHITMRGKLSIITFLHEFGHALGGNEYYACGYSTKLFKEVYPDQFARLNYGQHGGHMATQ